MCSKRKAPATKQTHAPSLQETGKGRLESTGESLTGSVSRAATQQVCSQRVASEELLGRVLHTVTNECFQRM